MLADSLTELNAARLMTYHVALAWETEDPKILHGKTAMAKLLPPRWPAVSPPTWASGP